MTRNSALSAIVLTVFLLAVVGWSQFESPRDGARGERYALAQMGIPLAWSVHKTTGYAGLDTLISPGFVFNVVWGYNAGSTCSLAVTSDPALVAAKFDVAVAADTMRAGHTAATYVGQAFRDTAYMPIPTGAFSIPGRASQVKLKGGDAAISFRCDGN